MPVRGDTLLPSRARAGSPVITWTLTPAGAGERTLVRVEAIVRDPALDGRFARARARRALVRIHARVLERLDAEFAAGR